MTHYYDFATTTDDSISMVLSIFCMRFSVLGFSPPYQHFVVIRRSLTLWIKSFGFTPLAYFVAFGFSPSFAFCLETPGGFTALLSLRLEVFTGFTPLTCFRAADLHWLYLRLHLICGSKTSFALLTCFVTRILH